MTSSTVSPSRQSILRDASEIHYNFSVILGSLGLDDENINELERFEDFLSEYRKIIPRDSYATLAKDRITSDHLDFLVSLIQLNLTQLR